MRSHGQAFKAGLELQADFLVGVWARYTDRVKHIVEAGDIEEAMRGWR